MAARQLLEIDSSIMQKNLLFNEDHLNIPDDPLHLLSSHESPEFKLVKPNPGFCVKFKLPNSDKVFINVCHTEELPAPRDITEEELAKIIQAEEISDFKIPMSIGDPHEESDKSGAPVTAYDIAINSKFFSKIKDSKSFSFLFLMIAIEGVENKFNIPLNHDYTVLMNRKCLGTLQYHRIRQSACIKPEKKKKVLIEEIPPSAASKLGQGDCKSKSGTRSVPLSTSGKGRSEIRQLSSNYSANLGKIPDSQTSKDKSTVFHRTLELESDGKNFIVTEVFLPNTISENDLLLNIGEDRFLLSSKQGSVLVDTFFKSNVNENKCTALFNTKCQVLTVIVPVI